MSYRKYLILFIVFQFQWYTYAQNLVTNPSFEDYINCPTGVSSVTFPGSLPSTVVNWYVASTGTSDYFNECSAYIGGYGVSIPDNLLGYQYARTGNAYGGFSVYYILDGIAADYREYLQTQLSEPFKPGHRYLVSYWISLAEKMSTGGVDQLAVHFLNDYINMSSSEYLDLPVSVASPLSLIYTDTVNWVNISNVYTASGGEEWAIFGTFDSSSTLNYDRIDTVVGGFELAYYYYDDVCILDLDEASDDNVNVHLINCAELPYRAEGANFIGAEYIWNDNDTSSFRILNAPGTYWVKSIDRNNCLLYIDTFVIEAIKEIEVNYLNDTIICKNDIVTLSAYDERMEQYLWNTGSRSSSIEVSTPGLYYVYAQSSCVFFNDSMYVTVIPDLIVDLPNDTIVCIGNTLMLQTNNNNPYVESYLWNTGENHCCIVADESGLYILTLQDVCGNSESDSIEVLYTGCESCLLFPNAFSPNGDGLNDKFIPLSNCLFDKFHMEIYNRWGQLVFVSFNIADGWDGTLKGKALDSGTYFYKVKAQPVLGSEKLIQLKGDLMLIR